MLEPTGRVIESPTLQFKNKNVHLNKGSWNNLGTKFYEPKSISNWIVYNFDKCTPVNQVKTFVQELKRKAIELGIQVADPQNISEPQYQQWSQNPFGFLEEQVKKFKPEFIMAILPNRSPIYGKFLSMACVCVYYLENLFYFSRCTQNCW